VNLVKIHPIGTKLVKEDYGKYVDSLEEEFRWKEMLKWRYLGKNVWEKYED
jgi:hypothetical protein